MSHARVGRAIINITVLAGLSVFLSAPADAGLRFGPGVALGLATLPLRMMTHGIALPPSHRHAAHIQSDHTQSAHVQSAVPTPVPAPAPHAASTPPSEPPAREARADPVRAAERARPAPPTATPAPAWPTASPSVYEDLLGYVLWPGDYADRLWTHGYGDIMNTLLAPAADADQAARMIETGMCSAKASALADQLIARTSEIIVPTPEEKVALDELAAALGEAIDRGRAAVCARNGDPLTRMENGLWTMWDATLLMGAPLEKFYDQLTPAQKDKLSGEAAASPALARACADQPVSGDRLAQALAERARGADPQQRLMLAALRQQSSELVKFLALSCPRETKPTPMDRLKAAGDRMNALLYVVMSMSPALSELSAPLNGEPKAPTASDR
jgi:hypothetical protein